MEFAQLFFAGNKLKLAVNDDGRSEWNSLSNEAQQRLVNIMAETQFDAPFASGIRGPGRGSRKWAVQIGAETDLALPGTRLVLTRFWLASKGRSTEQVYREQEFGILDVPQPSPEKNRTRMTI